MPELPEVETTRSGIAPHLQGQRVDNVIIRQRQLRCPIPASLKRHLVGQSIVSVGRRGKYILLETLAGWGILHLGMSGILRVVDASLPPAKHDHVDIVLCNDQCLRLTDPRRFGALLWTKTDPLEHKLLANLGPEPLTAAFSTDYLYQRAQGRKQAIKAFIMDSHVVVGVGNIYANEALFKSGIHPHRAAGKVSKARFESLVQNIKAILAAAIKQGGTTLKDFRKADGKPGYFKQQLQVYGRGGEPCVTCGNPLKESRLGQRSTVYCGACQR